MEENTNRVVNRLIYFEDCQTAIDDLFDEALKTKGIDAFDEFLDFACKFSNLSVYNAMLVKIQRPGASAAGSRRQWQGIGRSVKPYAVPIVILHPFGPVRFVFEASDTEGEEPLPCEEYNTLFAVGKVPEELYRKTKEGAEKYGVKVIETDRYGLLLAGTAAGLMLFPERVNKIQRIIFEVRVNSKHDMPTRFATVAHELGHIYCGHLGPGFQGNWPDRARLSKATMELEAEAVAWLVCQRNGIHSRSREYLGSLISKENIKGASMYGIYDAANRVESRSAPGVPEQKKV